MNITNEWMDIINTYMDQFVFYITIGAAVLLVINIFQIIALAKLKKFYRKFVKGRENVDVASLFSEIDDEMEAFKKKNMDQDAIMSSLDKKIDTSVDKVIVHKYDAFDNMTGETSSVILLLDRSNTGALINVIHGREGSYTYTKKINKGKSEVSLSTEEKKALEKIGR